MARFSPEPRLSILFLALALVLQGCAGGHSWPFLLHPIPPGEEQYALDHGAVRFETDGFTVSARPLDWRVVEGCYLDAGGALPYGDSAALSRLLFFSVRFENSGAARITFNPRRVSLFAGSATPLVPMEVSDIYRLAAGTPDVEARAKSFLDTSFNGSEEIGPGGALERYLVFHAPREKVTTVRLVLDDLYFGAESHDIAFLFETFPGAEAGD